MEELSGVMIVLIIGGGVLGVTMCFIFAKRQIVRFTLRQRRGPHVAVGHDAKKSIKKEIERRLDSIQKIYYEPKLIWDDQQKDDEKYILKPDTTPPPYHWRMKAVDDVKELEREIAKQDGATRHPRDIQLQQQQEQQFQQADLEENEILSISQYHGETG
uniref:Uncharacterized protein n=1 Tax=Anopheles farauti TaxID=69004 RepID=A0A182QNA4_9DIPT